MAYQIIYIPVANRHLLGLAVRQQRIVHDAVNEQLTYQPAVETTNRKRRKQPNLLADWELKIGNLRVYYNVEEANAIVLVRAIGTKKGNLVKIGKQVIRDEKP